MDKRTKAGQPGLFSEETGSPLFSGSPMKADDAPFVPEPESVQSGLFGPATFDELARDEEIRRQRGCRVHCPFCDALLEPFNGVLGRHATDGSVLFGGVFDESERELGREPCMGSGLSVP